MFLPFRVFDTKTGKMYSVEDFADYQHMMVECPPYCEKSVEHGHLIFNHCSMVHSNHGHPIYEDDFVEYRTTKTIESDMGYKEQRVVWKFAKVVYDSNNGKFMIEDGTPLKQNSRYIINRVLGNVHENPEIVKIHR